MVKFNVRSWNGFKRTYQNFYLIQRLAQFQIKITNHNNYLGIAWEVLNPALQIMYWLVLV